MEQTPAQRSVREALAELHLKTRMLEDERDYFLQLQKTTQKVYCSHAKDLQDILEKERDHFVVVQDALQLQLQRLLSDNTLAHAKILELREGASKNKWTMEKHANEICDDLRRAVELQFSELNQWRSKNVLLLEQKDIIEKDVAALLHNQLMLHKHSRRLKKNCVVPTSVVEPLQVDVKKPFVPCGPVERLRPSTHNVNALIQTIEKGNLRSPKKVRNGCQLHDVCRSVLEELVRLRNEYESLTDTLGNPNVDTLQTSRKLREVFETMEQKKDQLRKLRKTQLRVEDDLRVQLMIQDVMRQNSACESLRGELLHVLRSSSS